MGVMATRLRPHGWDTVLHDYGWQVCGGTYDLHPLSNGSLGSGCVHVDQYGRLFPSPLRFPSTRVNTSFGSWKPFVDKAHRQGIGFGLHLMQGIPKVAVAEKRPIYGSEYTADQIVAQPLCPSFVPDHWAIDAAHPGAAAYYDSLVTMWAEQVIPPLPSSFTLVKPYLADFPVRHPRCVTKDQPAGHRLYILRRHPRLRPLPHRRRVAALGLDAPPRQRHVPVHELGKPPRYRWHLGCILLKMSA